MAHRRRTPRRAGASRPSAPASRTVGAGCLAPVAAHHDGERLTALIAAEDGSWIERRSGADPAQLAAALLSRRRRERARVKVIVTRPRAQAQPLVERLEARGHEVVECPLIEIVRTSDEPIDCAGYEWLIVTSPNGADEVARRAREPPEGRGGRARARPRRCAATASSRPSSPTVSLAGRAARRVPAARRARCSSRRPRTRGAGRSTRSAPDFVQLYARVLLRPTRPRATSSCSRRARPRRRTPGSAARRRRSASGPRRRRVAALGRAHGRGRGRARTTSTGSSRRSAALARRRG